MDQVPEGLAAQLFDPATTAPASTTPAPATAPPAPAPVEPLAAYIALQRAQPGIVPELVAGATVADVDASVATAKQAYDKIAGQTTATPPAASGGITPAPAIDPTDGGALLRAGMGKIFGG